MNSGPVFIGNNELFMVSGFRAVASNNEVLTSYRKVTRSVTNRFWAMARKFEFTSVFLNCRFELRGPLLVRVVLNVWDRVPGPLASVWQLLTNL